MIRREREDVDVAIKLAMETSRHFRAVYGEEALEVLRNPSAQMPEKKAALLLRTRILLMANPPRDK